MCCRVKRLVLEKEGENIYKNTQPKDKKVLHKELLWIGYGAWKQDRKATPAVYKKCKDKFLVLFFKICNYLYLGVMQAIL